MARLIRVLALILIVGGCTAGAPGSQPMGDPFDGAGAGRDDVLLTVQNNDFRDASVYALWNGVKRRVGSVTGLTSQTFRMSWAGEVIQLEIDFVGGGGFMSDRMSVTQGDHLDFIIMAGAGE